MSENNDGDGIAAGIVLLTFLGIVGCVIAVVICDWFTNTKNGIYERLDKIEQNTRPPVQVGKQS